MKIAAFVLVILGVIGLVLSSFQGATAVQNQSQQQQLQATGEADMLAIREVVVNYVTSLQTYDYRKLENLDGLQYYTPDYRKLVEKYEPQIISRIKRDRETHKVECIQIDSIEITSPGIAYVTYRVKGKGTNHGERPVSVDVRGDIVCQKIAGKWLIDLDDLEPRKDVLVHIS